MIDQLTTAQQLLDEIDSDSERQDLTAVGLLDYMAIVGVSFTETLDASDAYFVAIQRNRQP